LRLVEEHASASPDVPRLYDGVAGPAADGVCVIAYTLRHMLQRGYTIEQLERPVPSVYREMIRFMHEGALFSGASGDVSFAGAGKAGNLALWQLWGNSTALVGLATANGTISLNLNGGPTSASWRPHPEGPKPPKFPMRVLALSLSWSVCACVCCISCFKGGGYCKRRELCQAGP